MVSLLAGSPVSLGEDDPAGAAQIPPVKPVYKKRMHIRAGNYQEAKL